MLLDLATNRVIRLQRVRKHDGWVLSSVKGREATLQKDQKTLVLNLPDLVRSPVARMVARQAFSRRDH